MTEYPNFTITVTLNKDNNTLKLQATCENVNESDVSYFLATISDSIKENNFFEGITRNNGGYIEEIISLV